MKKILKFIGKLILYFFGISIGLVILFKFVPVPFTPLMFIRTIEQIASNDKVVWKRDWISIDENGNIKYKKP